MARSRVASSSIGVVAMSTGISRPSARRAPSSICALGEPSPRFVDLAQQDGANGRLEVVGEDQRGELLADRPRALEAEELLGGSVPEDDLAAASTMATPSGEPSSSATAVAPSCWSAGVGGRRVPAVVGEAQEAFADSSCSLLFRRHPGRTPWSRRAPGWAPIPLSTDSRFFLSRPSEPCAWRRVVNRFSALAGNGRGDRERVDRAVVHPRPDRRPDEAMLVDPGQILELRLRSRSPAGDRRRPRRRPRPRRPAGPRRSCFSSS